jgi:hypothetical protein
MILFKRAGDLTRWLDQQRLSGKSIGFVPTLGALHAGHISLITISKKTAGVTVCSIFVNPTQFNDPRDFQKYPVTLEKDIALLEQSGTDVLFLPEVSRNLSRRHFRARTLRSGPHRNAAGRPVPARALPGRMPGHAPPAGRGQARRSVHGPKGLSAVYGRPAAAGTQGYAHAAAPLPDPARTGRPGDEQPECAIDAGNSGRRPPLFTRRCWLYAWAGRWATPQKQRLSPQR